MGIYLNPNNQSFEEAIKSRIYIDKTELLKHTNSVLRTNEKFICVSRPRRFGKSMAANMLAAYYDRKSDSREMFSNYKISKAASFEEHLNKYNVIRINMVDFLEESKDIEEMIRYIEEDIIDEIKEEYETLELPKRQKLYKVLNKIFDRYSIPFIFIIDEWDCVMRELRDNQEAQKKYLDFLRNLLKDKSYVALAYMTGILPIKKYGQHSALNMFTEISMTNAREYAEFTGFTESEVRALCEEYDMSFEETKKWYDGYNVKGVSIYNPRSVVMSMTGHDYDNYWTSTENYEALEEYICRNEEGLRDTITEMLAGNKKKITVTTFSNDMVTFKSADDVLTLLVHLGYLTYDSSTGEASIPNYEIYQQFADTLKNKDWTMVTKALKKSDELLEATLKGDAEKVAYLISESHNENTSIIQYNNENSLSCIISIAYYTARRDYIAHRELATGKGFADIVFVPRENRNLPAIIIELKKGHTAEEAIQQIKERDYISKVSEYTKDILLVGINYNEDKTHSCVIERV